MKKTHLLILLIFLLPAVSADYQWESMIPPVGGWNMGVTISPHDGNKVMIAGDVLGAAVSEDGGVTWQPSFGFNMSEMESFTFHQTDPNIVLGATIGGVYKSIDGGHTFTLSRTGFPPIKVPVDYDDREITAPVAHIEPDPNTPGTFYAGIGGMRQQDSSTFKKLGPYGGDIYKTTDSGDTWTRIYDNPSTSNSCTNNLLHITVDPFNSQTMFKTLACDGIWRSDDGGATWTKKSNGISEDSGRTMIADPGQSGVFFATTGKYGKIYKTTNHGDTWTVSSSQARPDGVVLCDKTPQNTLYTGSPYHGNSIWKSTDNGASWTNVLWMTENNQDIVTAYSPGYPSHPYTEDLGLKVRHHAIAVDPNDCDHVVAATGLSVFMTTNGGTTWHSSGSTSSDGKYWTASDYGGACVTVIEFDPNDADHIVLGGWDGIHWHTWDGGQTWMRPYQGITQGTGEPSVYYYVTIDASISHTDSDSMFLIEDPTNGGITNYGGILFFSSDGGETWTEPYSDTGYTSVEILRTSGTDNNVCIANSGTIYKSTDKGQTKSAKTSDISALLLTQHPTDPNILYASTEGGGVYQSTDGCDSWSSLGYAAGSSLASWEYRGESRVAIDPTDPDTLFYGGRYGLYMYDGGWSQLSFPVPNIEYGRTMAVDENGALLFMSGSGPHRDTYHPSEGIWKSDDRGTTWEQITTPHNVRLIRFYSVTVNPLTNEIWGGSACGGAVKLTNSDPRICLDNDLDTYDNCDTGGDGKPRDCNDYNANINPGATESCTDGTDNDCDTDTDCDDSDCDQDQSCCISDQDLVNYIDQWKAGTLQMETLVQYILDWQAGC